MKSWADILQKYAIDPTSSSPTRQGRRLRHRPGIDAMDLLHSGRSTVSAWSLRTATSPAWRPVFAKKEPMFTLRPPRKPRRRFSPGVPEFVLYREPAARGGGVNSRRSASPGVRQRPARPFHPDQKRSGKWNGRRLVGLGVVGQRRANIASARPRTYGFAKLSDLVRQTGAFEMISRKAGRCGSGRSCTSVPIPSCTGCGHRGAP